MDALSTVLTLEGFIFTMAVGLLAGVVKGLVGFAMPMIMISGLSQFLSPELALAGLIIPTLVTNGLQALRQGWSAAVASVKSFRVFLLVGGVCLVASAQLVPYVSARLLYLIIGVPVILFSFLLLSGWQPKLKHRSARSEAAVGAFAGAIGGVSGVWGPPTVTYLTAINTPKADQMRVQGTIYGSGALLLFLAHLQSGVLRVETLPLSFMLVPPGVVGLLIGFRLQDRIDQTAFRRATLIVLLFAGANLIRRAVMG